MDQNEENDGEDAQEMDRRVHRLVLPEDGYEWKKYGQKFIKNIRKFRSYFKCQESSCMAKKRAEWCTSDRTNVRIVYDGVHSHTHHGSSSSSADQPKRESPKDESPSEKAKKEYSKLPSNPEEVEDLRRDSAANPLIAFTYDELRIITANFRQDRVLGGGGFGCVYKGFISEDLREGLQPVPVAVKVHDGDNSYQGHREWLAEVIFLGHLSHPNLVKLIGYCCEDEHRVLIYEFMARGSVENNLFSKVLLPLPWSIRMKIAFGAAKGLAFLHEAEKPVIYRDFKTSNILLDTDYNAKLSDFGLAKDGPEGDKSHVSTRIMGTYGYAAPEYIMTGHLTPRSDVYSFGVVLLEILTGRKSLDKSRPAREQNLADWALPLLKEKKKLLNIIDPRLEGDYPVKGVHKAAMLAYHCLNHNPKARPLMRDIVDSLEPLQVLPDEAPTPKNFVPVVTPEEPKAEIQTKDSQCN